MTTEPETAKGRAWLRGRRAVELGDAAFAVLADVVAELERDDTSESAEEYAYVLCGRLRLLYGLGRFASAEDTESSGRHAA